MRDVGRGAVKVEVGPGARFGRDGSLRASALVPEQQLGATTQPDAPAYLRPLLASERLGVGAE